MLIGCAAMSRSQSLEVATAIHPKPTADNQLAQLPFGPGDVTVGSENEWMAAVRGRPDQVDLPRAVAESNYIKNLMRRAAAGEASSRLVRAVNEYLSGNQSGLWENSWVCFPRARLSGYANRVLEDDLFADKTVRTISRTDVDRFLIQRQGETHVRVPVSYLLKLAMAQVMTDAPPTLKQAGERMMGHFLNDNTSPETFSFHLTGRPDDRRIGSAMADETARRFLLTHLLTAYANDALGLREAGQETRVGMAPQTPSRQQHLNQLVADSFYRDLFMSPCLSGWQRGEEKHRYMHLCHEVLSRSRLNTMAKLRECGILARNLVTLPTVSNTSLANNGTHITLGSRRWTAARRAEAPGFSAMEEKRAGDLVTKIVEHFLPLLVGTYTAAPGRIDFPDFHPEGVLGFLPHELDYTQLRMLWRRWKGKAQLQWMGMTLTPFGPRQLDQAIGGLLRLRGDWIPDQRLIDYLIAPLSTDHSPALDGQPGNEERLKKDLAQMGIFDERMVWYALMRQRLFDRMGFCGFEGRTYSQFAGFQEDLAPAADLQRLITALACQYVWRGEVTHADIPDTPEVESERRQVFFGGAIGLPTFFIRKRSANRFMMRLLRKTQRTRDSHRYPGRIRVYQHAYRAALLDVLEEDAAGLVEALDMREQLADLRERIQPRSQRSAVQRLMAGILDEAGARHPLQINRPTFEAAAERFYGTTLHRRFLCEALDLFEQDLHHHPHLAEPLNAATVRAARERILEGTCAAADWAPLIHALIRIIDAHHNEQQTRAS
jgi:hypothetical protein